MPLPAELGGLLNVGAMGVVLAWFLFRLDARMRDLEKSHNILTRGQMLFLLSQRDTPEHIKEQARDLLRDTSGSTELR